QEKYIGTLPSENLQKLLADGAREGFGYSRVLEGDPVYTAFSHAKDTGWLVTIAIPLHIVEAGPQRSIAVYGGGLLFSLAFALWSAMRIARSINRPIDGLAKATRALNRDEPLDVPATDIREIVELRNALVTSAADARQARHHAEAASRAKDEFLAMLGHELRNPLAPIVTALRLMEMRSGNAPDRQRGTIERQVGHLPSREHDLLHVPR